MRLDASDVTARSIGNGSSCDPGYSLEGNSGIEIAPPEFAHPDQ
jgi:hypothetical protein